MSVLSPCRNQSGFALFMVLWVLTLLTILVGQFCFTMRSEANLTRNFKEAAEAFYIAEAGAKRALWELLPTEKTVPSGAKGASIDQNEDSPWRVNLPIPSMEFGSGAYTVRIENVSGRINLNAAGRDLLRMALDAIDIDETRKDIIVDSILDWRDLDELHRLNGAESDYYQSLPEPYNCKNGPFDTLSELLLVRGMTPEIFYDRLDKLLTVTPSSTAAPRSIAQRRKRRLAGNTTGININAASAAMLNALPGMTDDLAQAVIEYRIVSGDFNTLNEVEKLVGGGVYADMAPFITLTMSNVYTIHSQGRLNNSRVRQSITLQAVVDPTGSKPYRILRRELNDIPAVSSTWQDAESMVKGG